MTYLTFLNREILRNLKITATFAADLYIQIGKIK